MQLTPTGTCSCLIHKAVGITSRFRCNNCRNDRCITSHFHCNNCRDDDVLPVQIQTSATIQPGSRHQVSNRCPINLSTAVPLYPTLLYWLYQTMWWWWRVCRTVMVSNTRNRMLAMLAATLRSNSASSSEVGLLSNPKATSLVWNHFGFKLD